MLFDQDLTFNRETDDQHQLLAPAPDRWCWQGVPNGGYLLAMAGKAMAECLPHRDPVSVTATFVSRTALQPVDAQVEVLAQNKNLSQASVQLQQDGDVRVQAMGCFADFDNRQGIDVCAVAAPVLTSPHSCQRVKYPDCSFPEYVDIRLTPQTLESTRLGKGQQACVEGWIAFDDQRDPDLLSLLMFADSFPRAIEAVVGDQNWIPTLDYQVQCFAKPAPGYIACRFTSRRLALGLIEESGELWDSRGQLVAVSRQSASLRLSEEEEARASRIIV